MLGFSFNKKRIDDAPLVEVAPEFYGPGFKVPELNRDVRGPNPNSYQASIYTTRNNVKLSLKEDRLLETNTTSSLAARGITKFGLRGISFGALGRGDFTEGDLNSVEKAAYRATALHEIQEVAPDNSKIYNKRLSLRKELNNAKASKNTDLISSVESQLKDVKYKKGIINYRSYEVTDNSSLTREMKLFTGRAVTESIQVGGKQAVRIVDTYDFEHKGDSPVLSALAEYRTQQKQGFTGTRAAIASLSWLSNIANKYTGGATDYEVDLILSKDGSELSKEDLEEFRKENPTRQNEITLKDRMIGLGKLGQDVSGIGLAYAASKAMKKGQFGRNLNKAGKFGVLAGLVVAPLIAGAAIEYHSGKFDEDINVLNYEKGAVKNSIAKVGDDIQSSTSNFFGSIEGAFSSAGNYISNMVAGFNNSVSQSGTFLSNQLSSQLSKLSFKKQPSDKTNISKRDSILTRLKRVPGEVKRVYSEIGLDEDQARVATIGTLGTTALGSSAALATSYLALKKGAINPKVLKNMGKGALAVAGLAALGSAIFAGKSEAAEVPSNIVTASMPSDSPFYTNKNIEVLPNDVSVTDADSFYLFDDEFRGSTRLYGVDAPETSVYEKDGAITREQREKAKKDYEESRKKLGKSVEAVAYISQEYGAEATNEAKRFIKSAESIHVSLKQMDNSGSRRVVEVFNNEGESLSTHLVKEGLAFAELPTSKNFDGTEESYQRYELMLEAYQQRKGIFAKDDFILPSDFRTGNFEEHFKKELDTQIKVREFKKRGVGNNQYAYVLADEDTYFTLPASLGASAHYGMSLEKNLMKQNGYLNMAQATPYKGLAESLMEYNNHMLGGEPLSTFETFAARAYDSGLTAGGVGNWLNREVFMPMGWGRLYKDEKGALPSIAGLAGKILDESYLYYANINPEWTLIGHDYSSGVGMSSMESPTGMFQTLFEDTTAFGVSVAQSLGMYVAITQPMEMLKANIAKSFLDRSLESTILNNTPRTVNSLSTAKVTGLKPPGFADGFMADFYFGKLSNVAPQPGGLAGAVLEQRMYLDTIAEADRPAFFDHSGGPSTAFKAQLMVSRGRAKRVMDGTFKPFLIDVVNPFDSTARANYVIKDPLSVSGKRAINTYDKFNLAVNKLINVISSPVDLNVGIRKGKSVELQSIIVTVEDIGNDISIADAKAQKGGVHISVGDTKRSITKYSELSSEYNNYLKKINKHVVSNNEELFKLLTTEAGLSEAQAKHLLFAGGDEAEALKKVPSAKRGRVATLLERKKQFTHARTKLKTQLGSYADNLEITTTNTGIKYKTNIAAALQDVLEMVPLNPLKWGVFGKSAEYADEFMSVGQLFSFREAAEYTEQILTGETALTRVFSQFQPVMPDETAIDGTRLKVDEVWSNRAKSRIESFDSIVGATWKNIKSLWSPEPAAGPDINALTKQLRKQEVKVAKAAELAKVEGFNMKIGRNSLDAAKESIDVVVGEVDEALDLLDSVIDYSHAVRKDGTKIIPLSEMSKAIDRAGLQDVTGRVMRSTNKFSGNIRAEKFLGGTTGYIAATVFFATALNNIMQSTKGTSIATQLGFALFGEDEDLAVKFEANRFMPTEAVAVALGLDQTMVNLVADSVVIGGSYAVGYKIANQMKSRGFMPYTFDLETVAKMADADGIEVTNKANQLIDRDYLQKMGPGHDSFLNVRKTTFTEDGTKVIKNTILTRTMHGFKSERILQSFAEDVPTKAFIFGAIALLAMEGMRQTAATFLGAMTESPDDKVYAGMMAGLTIGGFMVGAGMDNYFIPKAMKQGAMVARTGGEITAQAGLKRLLHTGGAKWALGGAAVGAGIWAAKLILDPNVEQKGSLDPLIAGVAAGIGVGIFKASAGLGLAAGLVAMSAMSALNWAGIRVTKLGRAGKEVDPENAKLIAQLSQYSTAVLENEKDAVGFDVMMAAYASQFSSNKSILASDRATVAGETQVVAKQAPLPVLQFFVAERVQGRRGELYTRNSPDTDNTLRTYSLGIQSGALLGTSISVELPVAYTPGKGFFGFTYHKDNNLMAVPNFVIKVGVWAAATTGGVGIAYNLGAAFSNKVYKMTGSRFMGLKSGAENFARAADDLFSAGRVMFSAAEKITSFYVRTTVGIFSTLQGTDARMAFETYKNSIAKTGEAQDMLMKMSVEELTFMDAETQAKISTLDNVDGSKKAWSEIRSGKILGYAARAKHLAVGALIGSVAAGVVSDLVKNYRLRTSFEADASLQTLKKIEEQEERRKMLYVAIGGSAGAILNDIRSSTGLVKSLSRAHSSSVTEVMKARNIPGAEMLGSINRTMSKLSQGATKFGAKVLNTKGGKLVYKFAKVLGRNKMVGIAVAATLFNYIRTHSEFGIASMMDRHIVYDERGNAYDNYEQQTKSNFLHHGLVAATLGGYHTAIIGMAATPMMNQRATILNFAERELISTKKIRTRNIFNKVRLEASNIFFSVSRYTGAKESMALLENLLSIDNEFAEYSNWLEKKVNDPNLRIPKNIEKIEDVLKLRNALGKDEIKEFIALRNKKLAGVPIDAEEMKQYKGFLRNVKSTLGQTENFKHLARGFKTTSNLTSFSKRAFGVAAVAYLSKLAITTVMNQGGEVGKDSYLDRIYNKANSIGKIGQTRQDGTTVGLEGFVSIGADFLRMITGRDIGDLNYAVDALNGKMVRTTGQRLVSNAKGMKEAQRTVKDLSEMLILDNPNAYIATLDFGGRTLRNGDKGVTTSSYFQLQGPAQDISTATYSMAAKFIFNEYTGGRGRLGSIVDKAFASFDANNPDSFTQAGVNLRNATGMLHALKTSRKYSRATAETAATFAGDSLASMIIAARQEALAHVAWQPVDSLFTNMFFETLDKAKNRNGKQNFVKFLQGIAKSDRNVLKTFANLMEGGLFENFFRRTAISNVKFFAGSFGKPPKKGNAQHMVADISALWHQTHDISVQAEMFKQSRVKILDQFMDRTVLPMANHSVLAMVPDWMKIGTSAVVALGLSAFVTMSIAQYTDTQTYRQSTSELMDVFGRKRPSAGPVLQALPNNLEVIRKELHSNLANGQDYDWNFKATDKASIGIIEGVGEAGTQSRFIGLLNIGNDGKPLHVRFELSPYFDILDDADTAIFVKTLAKKGDHIRNLFMYAEETLDAAGKVVSVQRKTIAKALLNQDEIKNWLRNNSTGEIFDNVYDIFNGTTKNVTKQEFIGAAIENFNSKFGQGLDILFDLEGMGNPDHHLFQTVRVNGEEVLVAELLDPDFKTGSLAEMQQSIQGPGMDDAEVQRLSIEQRTAAYREKFKVNKAAFQEEVREIVQAEYDKIKWTGKGANVADEAAQIAEANRKALTAIKAKMADPSSTIGQIAKGGGLVQATSMPEEAAALEQASERTKGKKNKQITRNNRVKGNPIDEFVDDAWDTLQYQRPAGSVGFWDSLGAGGKGLMTAGFTMFDVITGMDVLGAYLRVAKTQSNPFATDLDKKMASKELGRAITSSLVGIAIGLAGGKLMKGMNAETAKKILTGRNIALGLGGAAILGIATGFAWKGLIKPGLNKMGKMVEESKFLSKGKETFDNLWFTASDIVGDVAAAPVVFAYNWGEKLFGKGKEAGFFTAGMLGGAALTAIIGVGLIGVVGISAPVLALTALGVGLITGVAALFAGDQMTSGMTYGTREFMKIPVIGQAVGLTDPYRQIRNQKRFQHHFVNSPFLLGYVGDLVNSNWLQMLSAAENPNGRDMVTLLFGEILSEGEGYNVTHSAWRQVAAEGLIGRPKPIVDEVISNELRIRAEHYADATIGRYTWDQLVQYSDNSNTIRAMEAQKRAEKIKIIERARAKAMKTAMDAGGPSQALKSGNPRSSALTQEQIARVDQVYADLDTYGKPKTQVTSAVVTTHKSSTENSDQKQSDEVKAQSLSIGGAGIAPVTKDNVYTGKVYIDKNIATIDFGKEQHPMNPIMVAEADALGANKEPSPGMQSQVAAYNSYKNES